MHGTMACMPYDEAIGTARATTRDGGASEAAPTLGAGPVAADRLLEPDYSTGLPSAFDTNIFEIIETTAQRTPTAGVTAPPRAGPVEKPWGE